MGKLALGGVQVKRFSIKFLRMLNFRNDHTWSFSTPSETATSAASLKAEGGHRKID
jgi:hypothetical protein